MKKYICFTLFLSLLFAASCGGGGGDTPASMPATTPTTAPTTGQESAPIRQPTRNTSTQGSLGGNDILETGNYGGPLSLSSGEGGYGRLYTITYGANVNPERYAQYGSRSEDTWVAFWPDRARSKPSQGWTNGRSFRDTTEALAYAAATWPTFTHLVLRLTLDPSLPFVINCTTRRATLGGRPVSSFAGGAELARTSLEICNYTSAGSFEKMPLLVEGFIEDSLF